MFVTSCITCFNATCTCDLTSMIFSTVQQWAKIRKKCNLGKPHYLPQIHVCVFSIGSAPKESTECKAKKNYKKTVRFFEQRIHFVYCTNIALFLSQCVQRSFNQPRTKQHGVGTDSIYSMWKLF